MTSLHDDFFNRMMFTSLEVPQRVTDYLIERGVADSKLIPCTTITMFALSRYKNNKHPFSIADLSFNFRDKVCDKTLRCWVNELIRVGLIFRRESHSGKGNSTIFEPNIPIVKRVLSEEALDETKNMYKEWLNMRRDGTEFCVVYEETYREVFGDRLEWYSRQDKDFYTKQVRDKCEWNAERSNVTLHDYMVAIWETVKDNPPRFTDDMWHVYHEPYNWYEYSYDELQSMKKPPVDACGSDCDCELFK